MTEISTFSISILDKAIGKSKRKDKNTNGEVKLISYLSDNISFLLNFQKLLYV